MQAIYSYGLEGLKQGLGIYHELMLFKKAASCSYGLQEAGAEAGTGGREFITRDRCVAPAQPPPHTHTQLC